MRTHIEHFGCTQCGGTLGMLDGQRVVTCDHCGTRNLVIIDDFVPRYFIRPSIPFGEAKRVAMKFVRDKSLAADLQIYSMFYDAKMYYLPVYEMTGVRAGKIIGRQTKKVNDGFQEKIIEIDKATVAFSDVHFCAPAARLSEWGIEDIPMEKLRQAQKLSAFDPGELEQDAVIFNPNLLPGQFDRDKTGFEGYHAGDQTKVINKSVQVVYVPVWLVKYTYRERVYRIVIDAVLGEILFARAPAGDMDRIPIMLAVLLFLTYPFARTAHFLFTGGISKLQEMGLAGIIGQALYLALPLLFAFSVALSVVAFAWSQFRYTGELVQRGGTREVERVNNPPENRLERAARALAEIFNKGFELQMKRRGSRWYT